MRNRWNTVGIKEGLSFLRLRDINEKAFGNIRLVDIVTEVVREHRNDNDVHLWIY